MEGQKDEGRREEREGQTEKIRGEEKWVGRRRGGGGTKTFF